MTVTNAGPIRHLAVLTAAKWLKNKLEALVVSRADRKPERKLATGSWQASSRPFPGNLRSKFLPVEKMMRRRGDEEGSRVSQQKQIRQQSCKNCEIFVPEGFKLLNCWLLFFFKASSLFSFYFTHLTLPLHSPDIFIV